MIGSFDKKLEHTIRSRFAYVAFWRITVSSNLAFLSSSINFSWNCNKQDITLKTEIFKSVSRAKENNFRLFSTLEDKSSKRCFLLQYSYFFASQNLTVLCVKSLWNGFRFTYNFSLKTPKKAKLLRICLVTLQSRQNFKDRYPYWVNMKIRTIFQLLDHSRKPTFWSKQLPIIAHLIQCCFSTKNHGRKSQFSTSFFSCLPLFIGEPVKWQGV